MTFNSPTVFRTTGLVRAMAALLFLGVSGPDLEAQVNEPGWRNLVSAEALSAFPAGQPGNPKAAKTAIAPGGIAPLSLVSGPSAAAVTPDLAELAKGLDKNPLNIFNYVRNKIEFQPYFGSHKGAHITYLDGAGNDMDQASLLIALLNEAGTAAGVTATWYVYGTYTMPDQSADGKNLSNWVGTPPTYAANVLNQCGVPVGTGTTFPTYTNWPIDHVWVRATIGGTTYDLDPSYKQYRPSAKIDFAAASGYSRSDLLDNYAGGTGNADFAQNLSRANVENRLGQYATNLRNYFKNTVLNNGAKPLLNSDADEMLGSRRILEQTATSLTEGSPAFSYVVSLTVLPFSVIPSQYAATLRVQLGTTVDVTFNVDSMQDKRLSLVFGSSAPNNGTLWLGDSAVVGGQETGGMGISAPVIVTVTHPATFLNPPPTPAPPPVDYLRTGRFDISHSFYGNPKSNGQIDASARRLAKYLATPAMTDSSREVLTETLYSYGLKWARRVDLSVDLAAKVGNAFGIVHHIIGRSGQESAYYVDMPDVQPTILDAAGPNTKILNVSAFLASAMEHGVIEQSGGSAAISTVKCLTLGNDAGQKIYKATSANYEAGMNIRGELTNYIPAQLNKFSTDVNTGFNILLHQDGQTGIPGQTGVRWKGFGFAGLKDNRALMAITGGLSGGYNSLPGLASGTTSFLLYKSASETPSYPPGLFSPVSLEPVNLLTGAYTMDHTDLTLGQQNSPRGLNFSRFYDSKRNFENSALGNGWRHSCEGRVTLSSDLDMAFGLTQPTDAAQTLVGILAAQDFVDTTLPPRELMVGVLAANWTVNRIKNNAANVQLGDQRLTFGSQPDGSWNPPPGGTTALTGASGSFVLSPRFGGSVTFDAKNRVSQWKDVDNSTQIYTYDAGTERLATVKDQFLRTLTFTYYAAGVGKDFLQSVTDSASPARSVQFNYTAGTLSGPNLTSIIDPEGFTTTLVYNGRNLITDWKDHALQAISHNDYDAQDRVYQQLSQNIAAHTWLFRYAAGMTVEGNPAGGTTTHLFDFKNRAVGTIDALGKTTSKSYDSQNHIVETKDATNRKTNFFYDKDQNLTKVTDNNNKDTTYLYDAALRPWKVTDPTLRYVESLYDLKHHLTSSYDAGRRLTQYFYRTDGLLDHIIDPALNTTSFTAYDTFGNPTNITRADGTTTVATYNAVGDMLSFRDGNQKTTFFTQDKRRLPKTRTDARTKLTVWSYDSNGNPSTVQDRNLQTTTTVYDNLGHLQTVSAPNTGLMSYGYDARDWLTSVTDGLSHTTNYGYDAAGRRKTVTSALAIVTQKWDYDDAGRVVAQYAGQLAPTLFVYDTVGRLDHSFDGLNQRTDHTYDDAGRALTMKNRRGNTFGFGYTADGLASTFTYPSARQSAVVDREAHGLPKTLREPSGEQTVVTYDGMKRVKTRTDGVGAITWTYDNEGNATDVAEVVGGVTKHIGRVYDGLNRVTSYTDAQGAVLGYTYDDEGNLKTLVYPGGKTVTYTYDGSNRMQTVTDWNGRVTTYQYDAAGRLEWTTRPNGTKRHVTYDNAGRTVKIEEVNRDAARLAYFGYPQYWDNGQPKQEFAAPLAPGATGLPATAMTYDADDQVTQHNETFEASDADGNLTLAVVPGSVTAQSSGTYHGVGYDARNRLNDFSPCTYSYDAENLRVKVTTAAGVTTWVVNPGGAPPQPLVRTKPGGAVTRYVWGLGLLYEEDGATQQTKTYHYDRRGSTVALSADDGRTVTDRWSYAPYGERLSRTGTTDTPFQFNGLFGVQTDASGLLYMNARYYNPELRRFMSEDPMGLGAGPNMYAFCNGDPIDLTDPFGLGPQGFADGFAAGFANAFKPENLLTTVAVTALTIAAPEVMIPLLLGAGAVGAGAGIAEWQSNDFAFNPNTAGQITGNFAANALISGGTSVGVGLLKGAGTAIAEAEAVTLSGKCFAAGTKVSTPSGKKKIEDVKKGDTVFAYDFETKKVVERKVLETVQNFTYHWVKVKVGKQIIKATRSHRFWVESKKCWVKAADLKANMTLRGRNGKTVAISSVVTNNLSKPESTYNFEVAANHDYFVGDMQVLVHNGGPNFIVTPTGQVFPVPAGAHGPIPAVNNAGTTMGFGFKGGSGGNGLDPKTTSVTFKDPNSNQNARAAYSNASGQKVNPFTGKPIGNADPLAHIPCP